MAPLAGKQPPHPPSTPATHRRSQPLPPHELQDLHQVHTEAQEVRIQLQLPQVATIAKLSSTVHNLSGVTYNFPLQLQHPPLTYLRQQAHHLRLHQLVEGLMSL